MLHSALRGDLTATLMPATVPLIGFVAALVACWRLSRGWGRATLL
jgi:hypothetical protein